MRGQSLGVGFIFSSPRINYQRIKRMLTDTLTKDNARRMRVCALVGGESPPAAPSDNTPHNAKPACVAQIPRISSLRTPMRFVFQIYEIHELKRVEAQPFTAFGPFSLRTVERLAH